MRSGFDTPGHRIRNAEKTLHLFSKIKITGIIFVMKNKFLPLWIFFHATIFLAFLISFFVSPKIHFGTSLFEILPPSSHLREIQTADTILGNKTSRAVTILVKSDSFEEAKKNAEIFYNKYRGEDKKNWGFFDSLSLYVDSSSVSEISDWLHENRFFLLSDDDISSLENGTPEDIANDAISSVYGAFSISDLTYLEDDPFLLTERILKRFLEDGAISSTNMSLKDDVLACQKGGDWYVLIRGTISEKGSAMASDKNAVKSIYATCDEILRRAAPQNDKIALGSQNDKIALGSQNDKSAGVPLGKNGSDETVEFIFSGVPFHSYENSSSAQNQISIISTVALILIIVVFLVIFRSPIPPIVSALAVTFSCAVGFISVLLFFRGIHILTFVFGTTLIGTCLDYSIHFFVNWKGNLSCENGFSVRSHIFRGITLGFLSTEICFASLFFAPFPLLKQVSVFLFFGLAAAYLSVISLYPMIKMPKKRTIDFSTPLRDGRAVIAQTDRHFFEFDILSQRFWKILPVLLSILSLAVIFAHVQSFKIKNNIQELYSMSPKMLENEIISAKILNTGSSGWYFILKGDSPENLLQKNENLAHFLSDCAEQKKLKNYLSVSQFIPSEKKQMKSFAACKNLLVHLESQYEKLGFDKNLASIYKNNYFSDFKPISADDFENLPKTIQDALANLWIGEVDGDFYSCVLPLHANREEEQFFRDYAENHDGIYFVNKVQDISQQLDVLSKTMLKMLALAFVIVIVILFFCYKPILVLKIASVPILVSLVTTAILILAKIHLSFFPITALILVFGLGLDYVIYAVEGKEKSQKGGENQNLNNFAILLSFVTTALSFGALAFSTFPPVHMLGLTVFAGLLTAIISSKS